ncbi:ganglioside-induced differentiation-associated protein 2 isoform X5 [Dermochelys coriacea]|uniref:ganglioside-induced differentiation-associated protein 2 isoform X5 n=1 Tax=Dermochelys coriacea TaxID=27794 RepID=UPI0018E714D2|nr:ganglioside-induced differentiation-associated protein 2 isoform X5 [Dermochelys coriacea]
MDPLGAPSQFVDIDSLPAWNDYSEANQLDSHKSQVEKPQLDVRSPFPYRKDINAKIILWKGNVALLNCTAIVNTSNESLTDKNAVSESIFMHAGPNLRDELLKLKGTVRRFLEIHGETLEKVVFAVSELEQAIYQKLLPLYFPRSLEEECHSLPCLPADIGNSEGEPVVPERQIRISEKPGAPDDNSDEEGLEADISFIGSHAFARMEGDVDKQRRLILQGQLSEAALQKQHQRNYNRWLCQARAEDLSDVASLKALYQTGVDNCGRTVMVVVGRNIPVTLIDMEKALLYFIHVMDHIAVKEYVIVYFHTLTSDYNHLDSDFLKKLYDIVDIKYKRNLKAVYFVHPTFRSKVSTWFFTTFTISGLKDKIHYVENLQQLFTAIPPEQIDFPPFVLEYDARENGPYYSYPSSPDL